MRALKYILVLCLLPGWVAVRGQDIPPDELYSADRPLDEVVVDGKLMRPDDIKQILGGFFNASDFSDALQAYRVKNDQDLTTLFADFEKATTVKIVPRSYIDFSSFWFDRVREWAEEDYAEAVLGQTRFISDGIIFLPLADGSYEVQLRLTPSLLLDQEGGIGRPMLDAQVEAVRLRYWHGSTFGSPKEARPSIATGHGELLGQLRREIAGSDLPAIDPDKEEYYRRMGTIIQNPEQPFREQLNVMWEAYKFFSLCVDQGWESHRENGVVPYCFWKDQSDPRVPFLAGVVDAAYIDTEAMSHLPELVEQIRESALELGYAYIVGSFKCPEGELLRSKEEYREIVTRMALSEPSFGAWKWLEEMVTTTDKERIDELESFFNGCEKVVAYREKLAEIKDFMQDWQAMLDAYLEIEGRVKAYLNVLKAGDDESWYERGFLTSQAALAVLPVGNFSKTKKARQVVELLKDESNWVRVTDNAGNLLAYANIRKYLGNSRVKQYLNTDQLYAFEAVVRSSHPDVLKYMDQMDEFDFAEMVRGYRDLINNGKAQTFIDAVKSADAFNGQYGWLSYWKLTPSIKYGITTIDDLRAAGKLLPTGNATDIQLGTLQAFTSKGDFINIPMRYNKSYLGEYADKGFENVMECLDELRKVPERLIVNERVFSGKTFSKAEFESKFIGGTGKTIDYPSFVSSSLRLEVAEGFIKQTAQHAGVGDKIAVIQRIITKNGVYIDDLSDWGKHLGPTRHSSYPAAIQIQDEVLLNPGKFRQTAEPTPIQNANGDRIKIEGYEAYYLDLIEL